MTDTASLKFCELMIEGRKRLKKSTLWLSQVTGLSRKCLYNYENKHNRPLLEHACRIAYYLNIDMNEVFKCFKEEEMKNIHEKL